MVQRSGKLNAKTVPDTSSSALTPEIVKLVKNEALIYTDEWLGCNQLQKIYDHSFVKHNAKEYVNGNIHTNTIENFWSILKRGVIGIYHVVTKKHLQKYVDEFVFRYNTRTKSISERFELLLSNTEYRMSYKRLVYGV